jgi:methylase of polypeptide subunit release factors
MKFCFSGIGPVRVAAFSALLVLGTATQPASAQRYTDPDTLAPAFPTPQEVVERMLTLAQVKPGEMVYDLGCGDGRIVITAAQKFKARGVGIEIRRDIYETTLGRVASLGLADQVKIVHGNAMKTDLGPADVVTLYLLTSSNEKLKPELTKDLKSTARVVSHDYEIRGWKPLVTEKMIVGGRPHLIYVYRMDSR